MKGNTRVPKQARSIEKKNKIIKASYELFSEVGYYGTNTKEIAKKAGVSTGILYEYFNDKRDILICVLNDYIKNVFEPILKIFDNITTLDYKLIISYIIETTIKAHQNNTKIHEALHSLTHTDEYVNNEFIGQEDLFTEIISDKLVKLGAKKEGIKEKVHLAMNLVQTFSHEYVFDNHEYINYDYMQNLVLKSILVLFE